MFIPIYPRGRPQEGELREILEEIFVKAGVDQTRSIEPPMSSYELGSVVSRLSDDAIVERFVIYAQRTHRDVMDDLLPVIPWRARTDHVAHGLHRFLQPLVEKLTFLPTGRMAKYVLLLEDIEGVVTFQKYSNEGNGTVLGEIHRGGVWNTENGQFFLLTWSPTVTRMHLGKRLGAFLDSDRAFFASQKQSSPLPPPPSVPMVQIPRRRPSSTMLTVEPEAVSTRSPDSSPLDSKKRRP